MASILEDLKGTFRDSFKLLEQIVVITAGVFVINNIFLNLVGFRLEPWFALHGSFLEALIFPWSFVSYMFLHASFFHILFNMLWLYWIGKLIVEYLGIRKFATIYFMGGMLGGLAYVLAFNIFEFMGIPMGGRLIGASAGVMSVVVAAGVLLPDYEIRLFLFGNVKLKYIALASFVLTTLLDFSVNTGGKLAHAGGALFGFMYIRQLRSGTDMSINFFKFIDLLKSPFKKKPNMRVVRDEPKKRSVPSSSKKSAISSEEKQRKTDLILDKISKSGYDSLTAEEKDFLFHISDRD